MSGLHVYIIVDQFTRITLVCLTVYITIRYYSWDDAESRCRSLNMSLPSIKNYQDVSAIKTIHRLENQDCGLMTFLAMKRSQVVINVSQ